MSRLAETFNKLLSRIEDSFKIQKSFLSNISHELRNPLASIISNIQVVLSKERNDSEYRDCLKMVLEEAIDLETTSSHLMDLARISSKSNKVLFGKIRIDEMIWQSTAILKKTNPSYTFCIDTDNLPELSENLIVNANEALLKTALINLLENACKFSPDQSAYISIMVLKNNVLEVEITDNAKTIPNEETELIFKPFYRLNSVDNIKGSGIGLSLVASILKVHEAKLTIKNNGEIGNIFAIEFNICV